MCMGGRGGRGERKTVTSLRNTGKIGAIITKLLYVFFFYANEHAKM